MLRSVKAFLYFWFDGASMGAENFFVVKVLLFCLFFGLCFCFCLGVGFCLCFFSVMFYVGLGAL